MRRITQTKLHSPPESIGNCWATCLACILDLDEIPEINVLQDDFWDRSQEIAGQQGFSLLEFEHKDPSQVVCWPSTALCILSGPSPRSIDPENPVAHAVIGRIETSGDRLEFFVEHDPHPSQSGITTVTHFTLILKR